MPRRHLNRHGQPIGDLIRTRRRAKHLTQVELASRLGVTEITVIRWEGDQFAPDEDKRRALAAALGGKVGDYVAVTVSAQERYDLALLEVEAARRQLDEEATP